MKLDALLDTMSPVDVSGPVGMDIEGVVCDSRQVRPGYVFVALPGRQADGWVYADEALQRGAAAVVSEHTGALGKHACHVQVRDAGLALARLSSAFHGNPAAGMTVVGVTGTNGKTTTTYLLREILAAADQEPGLITTVEYQIGARTIPATRTTPEAPALQAFLAQMVGAGCRSAVMEVSSHGLAQQRVAGIDFDIGIFTNLSRDHLDYHGDMESYFSCKQRLFDQLGRGRKQAAAVINLDDPWGQRLAEREVNAERITYGLESNADVHVEELEVSSRGTCCRVVTPWGSQDASWRLLGKFNVSNVLAAVAAGGWLGIDLERVVTAVSGLTGIPGRLEEVPTGQGFQVFVDYAHTDDALRRVLETLRGITRGKLTVIFGCGGNRDRTKRPVMGAAAVAGADRVIITSDNPRREDPFTIIDEIRAGIDDESSVEIIEKRQEALARALDQAQEGDVILVAGKGHESFQELANTTVPFDDRQVVARLVAEADPDNA